MFGEVAEKLRRSTVRITSGSLRASARERGSGSGVVWTAGGTVITNAHVVRDRAEVEFWDGSKAEAVIAARDDRRDLARLETSVANLPAAERRDSASLRPGEIVLAVGNPLGFVGALSTGVVHASGTVPGLGRQAWIQAAVRLAPGNSGGPLADAEGRVVGINTMMMGGGLALAVPSNAVADFLSRGARPSLGVVVQPIAVQPIAARSPSAGLLVLRVASRSPASRASVLPGDLLIGANDRSFDSVDDLGDAIDRSAGGILRLRFLRGDRRASREVAIPLQA
jgi:serine protease Do